MAFKAKPDALYLGDNGAALCGAHLGMTARTTGYDLSGQRIMRVTAPYARDFKRDLGEPLTCETCGKEAK
jgi:hypothetical protein